MDYNKQYDLWIEKLKDMDQDFYNKMIAMDENEKMESFSLPLEFGTGGLRGIMGVGPSRINIYTIERVTQGLAETIKDSGLDKSCAIAYDTRFNSELFAKTAALVLAANGINVHIFSKQAPTPFLSYTIRKLSISFGIVITASHNPKEYNGYKVYDRRGVQLNNELANEATRNIEKTDMFTAKKLPVSEIQKNDLITFHYDDIMEKYIEDLKGQLPNLKLTQNKGNELKIVYSALHGTGAEPVKNTLKMQGFNQVTFVQMNPDSNFGGLKTPNPETAVAYTAALKEAEKLDADIIFATDPDADRIGVQVKSEDGYLQLTCNQMASLLLDYLLAIKKENGETYGENDCVFSTIVSGQQALNIARANNLYTKELLTGFKYIGNEAEVLKEQGKKFLFGYEESYGILTGDMCRDKDAVSSAALICEMALYYKLKGVSLKDKLSEINEEFGYYYEGIHSFNINPLGFADKIKSLMSKFRDEVRNIGHFKVTVIEDYLYKKKYNIAENNETVMDELPASDVLKLYFEDGTWMAVRPSGTEPKIKFYYAVNGKTNDIAKDKFAKFKTELDSFLNEL